MAAAVALMLVLGVSAVTGIKSAPPRPATNVATGGNQQHQAGTAADATSSGIPLSQLQPGSQAATSGPAGGKATAGAATASGTGAQTGPAASKVVYDQGASDTEVRLGGSTFTSGPAATYGEQIAVGFAAGVNYLNDHGGIGGRRVTVKIYDDGADPAKQLANVKRLVEVDKVFAVAMAYAPIAGDYVAKMGVPMFLEGQFNEDFTNPWYFSIGGPQMTSGMALAWYGAKKLGVKTVSIFYLDAGSNNYSRAFADKMASYWRAYGVTVKSEIPFAPDQTSCSQGVSAARADNVDFIDFELDAGHVIQCAVESQVQGYKPPKSWGGYLIGVPVIHEALGDYSQGMYAFDAFGDAYQSQDYINEVKRVSNKTDTYSSVTMGFFLSAVLAGDGMRLLGDNFTRAHLRDVLDTFKDWRPPLTTSDNQPKWTWNKQCHVAIRGGYLIQIRKQPNGSLRWDQITAQGSGVPLPPNIPVPPEFAGCSGMFVPGDTAQPF